MSWDTGLQGKALAIAGSPAKHLRVMAGPGTGKSFAMKRRIARLLEQNVDPKRILAITFTRVAAFGLVQELNALKVSGCEEIHAGTLHSFCFRLLGREDVFTFSQRVPRPLIPCEIEPMLEDLKVDGKREDRKKILAFEAAWARLQTEDPGWPMNPKDKLFHQGLLAWLQFHRGMLIGELVPETLRYLRGNPHCAELSAFDHVIVDEYQDLNRADQVLLDAIASDSAVVIGDENQSIYRFRYAHPQGINDWAVTHPNTVDQDLDECRRCPTAIVEIANHLILHNHPGSSTPKLRPLLGNKTGEVHCIQWSSLDEEAKELAAYVKTLLATKGYLAGDILILSPRRLVGYQIRDELASSNIPVHSFYQEEALEEPEAQLAYILLNLLADSDDRVALRYWLGFGSPSWRKGEYLRLRNHCEQIGCSPKDGLEKHLDGTAPIQGIGGLANRYKELQTQIAALKGLAGVQLLNALAPESSPAMKVLRDGVLPIIEDTSDARQIMESVRSAVTQPEMPEDGAFVRIMSLQKSKGLTSKVVIVAAAVEGFIPMVKSDLGQAEAKEVLEEQRRLFYVAVTRATDILVISSFAAVSTQMAYRTGAAFRGRFGTGVTVTSRFIQELGPTAPHVQKGLKWKAGSYQ